MSDKNMTDCKNQREMANWYFLNILQMGIQTGGKVIKVNEYIIKRWSYGGLKIIKRLAWKLLA